MLVKDCYKSDINLKPFIKWPGGKTQELDIIKGLTPYRIDNYIEPFLGGGASYFSLFEEEYEKAYLNDYSSELIKIYKYIKSEDTAFINKLEYIWELWKYSERWFNTNKEVFLNVYFDYKKTNKDEMLFKKISELVRDINTEEYEMFFIEDNFFLKDQLLKSIISKCKVLRRNENKRGNLVEEDIASNLEAGVKAGIYTYYRTLYNMRDKYNLNDETHIALFYFIREFCFGSMFRYNKSGGFNVPYGGMSYNNKDFKNKINYIKSKEIIRKLKKDRFYDSDFEDFLKKLEKDIQVDFDDFMFVDPPYDTKFSTYANNSFEMKDQERLADYLLNEFEGKFLLIIKNTEYIYNLYNKKEILIEGFDKKYTVSFKDRNNQEVEHLIIRNYK